MQVPTGKIHGNRSMQHGFTVIELMIVVTIAAILSMIAVPYMQDLISNQRIRAAVTDMQLSLLFSRSEAIKRNDDVNIVRTGGDWKNGWTVQTTDPTTLRTNDALSDEITVVCNTDGDIATETCPATVTFGRNGRPDTMIEYRLYEAGNPRVFMRCVSVTLSGQPDIVVDSDQDTTNGCN